MARIKKHRLRSGYHLEDTFTVIGITTDVSPVKIIFDFNRLLPVQFTLNKIPLISTINDFGEIKIPIYISMEEKKEDTAVVIFGNQIRLEKKNPAEMFAVESLHYIVPALKTFQYFIFIPANHRLSFDEIQSKFKTGYFTYLEEVDIHKFTPFPVFPPREAYS